MRADRRIAIGLLLAFAGFYLITTGAERPWGDGNVQYKLAKQVWTKGRVDIEGPKKRYLFTGPDGRGYSTFSLGIALSMGPSVLAVETFAANRRPIERWAVAHRAANTIYGALAVMLFFLLARRLSITRGRALFGAVALGVGTQLWVYSHSDFSESYQTLSLLLAVYATVRARDGGRWAWVVLGLVWGQLFLAKVVYYALVPAAFGYLAWYHREHRARFARLVGLALLAASPFIAAALWYNFVRSGSLLGTGRRMDHFAGPMAGDWLVGLHGLIFSSGKGLFWFNPIVIGSLFGLGAFVRRRGPEAWLVLAVIVTLIAVYAKYVFWHGAWSFGPRFLTCLTPLLVLPLLDARFLDRGAHWAWRGALAALFVTSVGVQTLGCAIYEGHHIHVNNAARRALLGKSARDHCGWCHENHYLTHFVPQFNAISVHWWLVKKQLLRWDAPTARRAAPWATYFPDELNAKVGLKERAIDFWIRRPVARSRFGIGAVVLSVLLMLAGLLSVRRGWRSD
jgi:hypothetical protein